MTGVEARQLAHFLAVVDHGSVTRAAEALYISQPSLSQALRSLEKRLGVRLFRRTGRGVVPTEEGLALVDPARRILATVDDCRSSLRAVSQLQAGRLVVVADAMLTLDPFIGIVDRWHRAHPDVVIDIRAPHAGATVSDLVRSGVCEVGIIGGTASHPFLTVSSLGLQEMFLVLPPGSQAPDVVALADLAGDPPQQLVVPPAGSSDRDVVDAAFDKARVRANVVVECPHLDALGSMVLAGAGATFFPQSLAEWWGRLGAVLRRTRPAPVREVAMVTRPAALSPVAASFLEFARELRT